MPPKKLTKGKRKERDAETPAEAAERAKAKAIRDAARVAQNEENEKERQRELGVYHADNVIALQYIKNKQKTHLRKQRQAEGQIRLDTGSVLANAPPAAPPPVQDIDVPHNEEKGTGSLLTQSQKTQRGKSKTVVQVATNFSMKTVTKVQARNIVKTTIKDVIFRKCKFFNRFRHSLFSTDPTTMCGQILKQCEMTADASWWHEIRPRITKTITDHRNNCIKRMQKRFKEYPQAPQLMDGSDDAVARLLMMRQNCRSYCEILDLYGPAILGNTTWNDDKNMSLFCATSDVKVFAKRIMSVSDEAFIVLVLLNSAARWKAEMNRDEKKRLQQWTEEDEQAMPVPKYTFSRLKGAVRDGGELHGGCGGGSGWNKEGHSLFVRLQESVEANRAAYAVAPQDSQGSVQTSTIAFNRELYVWYQQRRARETVTKGFNVDDQQPTPKNPMMIDNRFDEFSDSDEEKDVEEEEEDDEDDDLNSESDGSGMVGHKTAV